MAILVATKDGIVQVNASSVEEAYGALKCYRRKRQVAHFRSGEWLWAYEPHVAASVGAADESLVYRSQLKIEDLKRLRNESGCGLRECKDALEKANWNYDAAMADLRTRGF